MTFVIDRGNYRTYDPERGFELFVVGGGNDGIVRFKLTGKGAEAAFSATCVGQSLRPEELTHLADHHNIRIVVWTILLWQEEWEVLIREAMEAYLINHGSPLPGSKAFVRFGSRSVFEAIH